LINRINNKKKKEELWAARSENRRFCKVHKQIHLISNAISLLERRPILRKEVRNKNKRLHPWIIRKNINRKPVKITGLILISAGVPRRKAPSVFPRHNQCTAQESYTSRLSSRPFGSLCLGNQVTFRAEKSEKRKALATFQVTYISRGRSGKKAAESTGSRSPSLPLPLPQSPTPSRPRCTFHKAGGIDGREGIGPATTHPLRIKPKEAEGG
jgi:hypothetical protein